jgi:putative chitinase
LRLGEKIGINFYDDPNLIVAPENALQPAVHEWSEGNLSEAADRNDIRTITRVINSGYNGLPDRQMWFDRIWEIANSSDDSVAAWRVAAVDENIRWLQSALNDLGAQPQVLVDGRYGPHTAEAIKWSSPP